MSLHWAYQGIYLTSAYWKYGSMDVGLLCALWLTPRSPCAYQGPWPGSLACSGLPLPAACAQAAVLRHHFWVPETVTPAPLYPPVIISFRNQSPLMAERLEAHVRTVYSARAGIFGDHARSNLAQTTICSNLKLVREPS
ncbi:hypothetical protein BO86DRAFT_239146 [Aspergillus japonicus CBS 114.51]|uniref:Uncharacterized protein n=1 Tax=Aspergillus japonicus CBS 114.51 TaxID=1448312 RepID=A0A8T8XA31_ASPJA|nr:hypothetical protein BO86DRAFT_239146 [Aspergillus japonicus CBS 114.51]RAH84279.1 hypothetical protein BO86DRAFT_239146 [Aspergillus japonicus CBS 114.51]